MVTTNQKHTIDSQKPKRKELKQTTKKLSNHKRENIKGETEGNTITVGDFNTPLTSMDRSSRKKTNKATEILNHTTE